jgi:hypothetical protein
MGLDIMPLSSCTYLGAMTGSNSTELPVFVAETACRIVAVDLVDITGVTGHTANYGTATLTNKGTAATGTDVVATRSTNVATTNDITADKPWALTLSSTQANLEVGAGECLTFSWTEAGTGQDLGGALLVIHYAVGTGLGN